MTKKFLQSFILTLSLLLLIPTNGHAQTDNPFAGEVEHAQLIQKKPEELFQSIRAANESVQSINQIINTTIVSQTEKNQFLSQQISTMELLFDSNQKIRGGYLYNEFAQEDASSYSEKYLPLNEKAIWSRSSEVEEWEKTTSDSENKPVYYAKPNYHSLIEKLTSNAENFKIYEDNTSYIMINDNHSADLFKMLQKEFQITLSGVQAQDFTTNLMITFDKEKLHLQDLVVISRYQTENNYLEMNIITEFSDWDQLREEDYEIDTQEDLN
ncbi:hypothetical protein [Facklamia sp. 7083-14-GEN3]|uniref:hypothetical protein n=1 Tax=Facklamia sp. 7083-14-GEN3 TaxID=2973478 RepID=UPI00215CB756|nr:hypothetical protein [Facklamia sp. 7083-14-GEN3]MCR8969349.1 hypothetical protein [Facklamia sp. 7083-14-GEN3]